MSSDTVQIEHTHKLEIGDFPWVFGRDKEKYYAYRWHPHFYYSTDNPSFLFGLVRAEIVEEYHDTPVENR